MKEYTKPNIEIREIDSVDCICASGETNTVFANQLDVWDET